MLLGLCIVASGFTLILGLAKFPVPVVAVILVIVIRERRVRTFRASSEDTGQLKAVPWGIVAGAAGFFVSQLLSPPVDLGLLVIGALGIGGAIGFFTSTVTSSLTLTVPLLGRVFALLTRGR